jgi:translation initiation factor 2 subunit 2
MSKDNYESMLDEAYVKLPEVRDIKTRFEVPKVRGHIQGNTTIISNFHQIAQTFNRPVEHMFKFILKELATPGDLKKNGIIFGAKVPASRINEKIEKYAVDYVYCGECGKPDTKLLREGNYLFKRCLACGAKLCINSKK